MNRLQRHILPSMGKDEPKSISLIVGKTIKKHREKSGISQEELAERAGKLPVKNNSQQNEATVAHEATKVLPELEQIKLESEQKK